MKKIILVKLGGSLITDKSKPFSEDSRTIKRLVREIHQARKQREIELIIGHGGGSYPHVPAQKYRTAEGFVNQRSSRGIAEVQDAAARLNRIVVKELLATGEDAVSINPSSCMIAKDARIKDGFLEPLIKLLGLKILPVVYGDVALDEKQGCCILSTEMILNFLALRLQEKDFKILRIIHCGKTDGVYDAQGKTIFQINPKNFTMVKESLGASNGIDVTGGMLHKVEECLRITRLGISSQIINGLVVNNLKKAILRQKVKGTLMR